MVIVVVGGEKCLDVEGKIDQFLKDVEVDAVFVTHSHDDHFFFFE
jgi:phosphoribosyl 1,2-cyclic phosphodiesterase